MCVCVCTCTSVQYAVALGVLLRVCGVEQLDRLFVDQSPELLKGDVVATFHLHLIENLGQTLLVLHTLGGRQEPG